jgi:hypothetical protein
MLSAVRAWAIASTPWTVTRRRLGLHAIGHVENFATTVFGGLIHEYRRAA